MPFPHKVAERALLDCGRHCCVCHKFCGFKIELHHIKPRSEEGEDTYDNCIPLCFDCHAEVKAYNPKHPKGRQYTESELRGHRDRWYKKVEGSQGTTVNSDYIELDRKLFLEIRDILPSTGTIAFVRDHGYEQPFEVSSHDDLHEFLEHCKRPEFEFLDADLEGLRANLAEYAKKFFITLSRYVTPDTRPFIQTREGRWYGVAKHSGANRDRVYNEKLLQEITEINDCSTQVWTTYEALVRLGRRKLGV